MGNDTIVSFANPALKDELTDLVATSNEDGPPDMFTIADDYLITDDTEEDNAELGPGNPAVVHAFSGPGEVLEPSAVSTGAPGGNTTRLTLLESVLVAGVLSIQDSAEVICDSALVGSTNEGSFDGGVDVGADGFWDIAGILTIGDTVVLTGGLFVHDGGTVESGSLLLQEGSRIQGDGTIIVISVATINGTLDPATLTTPPLAPLKDSPSNDRGGKEGVEPGTLTLDGDVSFDGGTIEIDVAALDEGEFDSVVITGTAELIDTTIQFNFIDGFLPLTGDQIPFLDVTGGATTDNLTLEYTGAADGFQFDVMEQNGMLVFEAQNDAQPLPDDNGITSVGCPLTPNSGAAVFSGGMDRLRSLRDHHLLTRPLFSQTVRAFYSSSP